MPVPPSGARPEPAGPILFTRKPLRFPDRADFGAAALDRLESLAAEAVRRWSPPGVSPGAFADWLRISDRRARLEHRLSAHWVARRRTGAADQRTARDPEVEREFVRAMKPALLRALETGDSRLFTDALQQACTVATGTPAAPLRTGAVQLDADTDGTTAEFCEWKRVPALLARLQRHILDSGLPPAARSIAAMAGLLNIHPFRDGNGRCARLLFHTVLGRGAGVVFPLRTLFEHSAGGFELSLREAEINGRWVELAHYFEVAFELLAEFAPAPASRCNPNRTR